MNVSLNASKVKKFLLCIFAIFSETTLQRPHDDCVMCTPSHVVKEKLFLFKEFSAAPFQKNKKKTWEAREPVARHGRSITRGQPRFICIEETCCVCLLLLLSTFQNCAIAYRGFSSRKVAECKGNLCLPIVTSKGPVKDLLYPPIISASQ